MLHKKSYTLYHGTVRDNEQSIRDYGLEPQVGKWVEEVFGGIDIDWDEEDMDKHGLVFAADKSRFDMAVYAMLQHVGYKLNKSARDVTEEDIIKHGMLVIVKDGEEYFQKRPSDEMEWDQMQREIFYEHDNPLYAVEPEDWFSVEGAPADIILTGNKLLSYIKRRGAYPLKRPMTEGYRDWLTQEYIKQERTQSQQDLFPRDVSEIQEEISPMSDREIATKLEHLGSWLKSNGFEKEAQATKTLSSHFNKLKKNATTKGVTTLGFSLEAAKIITEMVGDKWDYIVAKWWLEYITPERQPYHTEDQLTPFSGKYKTPWSGSGLEFLEALSYSLDLVKDLEDISANRNFDAYKSEKFKPIKDFLWISLKVDEDEREFPIWYDDAYPEEQLGWLKEEIENKFKERLRIFISTHQDMFNALFENKLFTLSHSKKLPFKSALEIFIKSSSENMPVILEVGEFKWVDAGAGSSSYIKKEMQNCGKAQWGCLRALNAKDAHMILLIDENNQPQVIGTWHPNIILDEDEEPRVYLGAFEGRKYSGVDPQYYKYIKDLLDYINPDLVSLQRKKSYLDKTQDLSEYVGISSEIYTPYKTEVKPESELGSPDNALESLALWFKLNGLTKEARTIISLANRFDVLEEDQEYLLELFKDRYNVKRISDDSRTTYEYSPRIGDDWKEDFTLLRDPDSEQSWERTFSYNPDIVESYDITEDKWGINKSPILKEGWTFEIPQNDNYMYRGMAWEEYQSILEDGFIKSKGEYNIGEEQIGLTYFSSDAGTAQHYAHGFAQPQYRATIGRPAVVIAIPKREGVQVSGTGEDEIGIPGSISADEIKEVWLGKIFEFRRPGSIDVINDWRGRRRGSSSAPSMSLAWKKQE